MAVLGYYDVYPEKMGTEIRTAIFEPGDEDAPFPGGTFIFTEYYCTDPTCDCQRVLIKVLRATSEDAAPDDVATFSYTWNSEGGDTWKTINSEMPNPFLDPFHHQASYADELLDFWSTMVEHDRAYALRLRRHYAEIRAEFGQAERTSDRRHTIVHAAHKGPKRPLSKSERKARRRRLARARKQR